MGTIFFVSWIRKEKGLVRLGCFPCQLVGASRLQVAGLLAFVADALGAGLRWTVARQVALFTTIVAFLRSALGAVTRHMTNATAGIAGLAAATTAATATETAASTSASTETATAKVTRTARGTITCYVTLSATAIAFSSRSATATTATTAVCVSTGAAAPASTCAAGSTAGLGAVTGKVTLVSTLVARLGFGSGSAFSTDVAFGAAVVAGWGSSLGAVASLVRRVTAIVAASIHGGSD